jgi:anti-sigma regulatory factor (Ser/Thr protein kinase)
MADLRTELTLPGDLAIIPLVRGYARGLARLAQLPDEDVDALELAADEACTNVVKHAFEQGEAGSFRLVGELDPRALTLAIHEQGVPFDPSLVPSFTPSRLEDPATTDTRGLGLFIIGHVVDEARWINHGRAGKELRLVKYRPQRDVRSDAAAPELARYRNDEPQAPAQEYVIRRLEPGDAIQVARCVYRAYGYSYPNDDLYYPERIARLNAEGDLISAVTVDEAGEIVGHYALERKGPGRVAESGQAIVAPAHRGRRLMERMRAFLEDAGRDCGLIGIYGQPVTNHVYSQRVNESFGSQPCAVSLALAPRSLSFRGIQTEPLAQRESLLLYFKYLLPPSPAVVYAPPRHRALLARIYAKLAVPVEFRDGDGDAVAALGDSADVLGYGAGEVEVYFKPEYRLGIVRVQHMGPTSAAALRRVRRELAESSGAEAIFLELPLADRGTPGLCLAAEREGFFFSGVGPSFAADGDMLRLQYLNTPLDMERLQIASPFGRELCAYVEAERQRVAGLG